MRLPRSTGHFRADPNREACRCSSDAVVFSLHAKTRDLRISASCFPALSRSADWRFLSIRRIRLYLDLSSAVTPQPAAVRLDSTPLPLPENKPARQAAPARADRPFRGIALILASTVFLGTSDVTAKYLSVTLPSIEIAWIRFAVFAMIMV